MVLFPKECCEVGCQGIDELLPLRAIMGFQPAQIVVKTVVPGFAQTARQAAVHHGVLAIVQADSRSLVNQRLHLRKVRIGPHKLAPLGQRPRWHGVRSRMG
jgi:hypothetical protein